MAELLAPAVGARLLLWANHVLAAHPLATQKLRPHAGRSLRLQGSGWPVLPVTLPMQRALPRALSGSLPAPSPLNLRITPAGLLDLHDPNAACDLTITADTSDPLRSLERLLAGELPPVDLQGDAGFAADVSWVLANVRWDVAADIERQFGPVVADQAQRASQRAAGAAQTALQGARSLFERWRPPTGG